MVVHSKHGKDQETHVSSSSKKVDGDVSKSSEEAAVSTNIHQKKDVKKGHLSDHKPEEPQIQEKKAAASDAGPEKVITISGQALLIGFLVVMAVGLVVWRINSNPPQPMVPPQTVSDDPVAWVNGENIMRSEIQKQLDTIPLQARAGVLFGEVLNSTIKERILLQEAKRLGIGVSNQEAKAYLALMMNSSGISPEELSLRAKEKGVSEPEIVELLQRRLTVNALLQEKVFLSVNVSDEEVEKFFNAHKVELAIPELVHAKHILLAQMEEANATLSRLKRGASFEELAKEMSIDKGSAKVGGDLGNFSKGMMVPEFEKAAFDAKPGSLAGPVKSAFGYHIIKVLSHTKLREPSLTELDGAIRRKIKADKSEAQANAFVKELEGRASVKFLLK